MMRPKPWRAAVAAAAFVLASAAFNGCAHDPQREDPARADSTAALAAVALALRGENAIVRIAFPKGAQAIDPGQFQHDEVCYLKAGAFRIDCFTDGSSLNFGPTDSTDLLTDNPGWTLEPANDDDKQGRQLLHVYAVLSLVAGSVDRLPAALSDYIQSPGQHLSQALDLAEKLLGEKRVRLDGHARGGNFTVFLELSDAGREKLEDALDEVGGTTGDVQWVNLRAGVRPPH